MGQAFQTYVPRAGNVDPVGDGLPVLRTFYPERYHAKGDDANDDTTGVQDAISAAVDAGGGTVRLAPAVAYKLTDELVIDGPVTIDGAGANVLFGPRNLWGSDVAPTVSPWLSGAILRQTTGGANGIRISVVGGSVRLRNFGVRFADAIRMGNTGHGIVCDPGAYLTYKNNGLDGFAWDNLKVYGHDGNHYGFYLINAQLGVLSNLSAYGGGGIKWETNSGIGWYGNSTIINPYCLLCAPGTAVGYHLHNTVAGHGTILLTFIRPQTFKIDSIPAGQDQTDAALWLPNINNIAQQAQSCFFADDDSFDINVIGPDFEPMSGTESIRLPNDLSKWLWTAGHCPGSQYDGVSILGGLTKLGTTSGVGAPLFAPSGGQATASGDLNPLTTGYVAVPGLTTGALPAGTYNVTATLRWFNTGGSNAQMTLTDSTGTLLSPEVLMYATTTANEQGSTTMTARITLGGTTTIQARAKSSAGGGIVLHDAAGTCLMTWTRVGA